MASQPGQGLVHPGLPPTPLLTLVHWPEALPKKNHPHLVTTDILQGPGWDSALLPEAAVLQGSSPSQGPSHDAFGFSALLLERKDANS